MAIGTYLFNPFTGQPRDPKDIESDPNGVLIWDGDVPLKADLDRRVKEKYLEIGEKLCEYRSVHHTLEYLAIGGDLLNLVDYALKLKTPTRL